MAGFTVTKVNYAALESGISKFNTCKAELADAYMKMSTEAMALCNTWKSPASQAFMNRMSELIANIKTSDATIEQAVQGLQTALETFREAENMTTSLLSNMAEVSPFSGV